jgi:prepilin-type processing-associated H-X9-DG protein
MGKEIQTRSFTILDLLVVIAAIALLMSVLIPALAKLRQRAFRTACSTNLSVIGKAMVIYSNDYRDQFPRAGGITSIWGSRIPNWQAENRFGAYGLNTSDGGRGGQATITSSFFLLVKYAEVTPKSFVCKGDPRTTALKPAKYGVRDKGLVHFWDFGPEPVEHCSYSYHMPYGPYALTTSYLPNMAVAADRNPWIQSPFAEAQNFSKFDPNGTSEHIRNGNTIAHKGDGQNVLYMDGHVTFEKKSFCGVNEDNIYTFFSGSDVRRGAPPTLTSQPKSRIDSMLVNDPIGVHQK